MKQIKNQDTTLSYQIYGQGDTILLFVHGSYIDQSYWEDQVDFFSSRYTVVTLDLAGHGQSGKERDDWSLQRFAEDVVELIRALNLKNVVLVGHSMGGDIVLIAYHLYPEPVIGIIGVDYFKMAGTPLPPQYQAQVPGLLHSMETDFANTNEQYVRMSLVTPETPVALSERVIRDYRNAYKPMGLEIMAEIFKEGYKIQQELLPQLRHKLYLINVDYFPTDEEALKKYTGSGYAVAYLHGTSHYPMIEQPEEFNHALQKVLEEIEQTKINHS